MDTLAAAMSRLFMFLGDEIVDRVPEDLRERAGQIADDVRANPVLLGILIVIGVVTALIFLWGIFKQVVKAAIIGGAASAAAWYWYFNIR